MTSNFTVRRYDAADADAVQRLHKERSWDVEYPDSEDLNTYADLEDIESHYLEAGGEFLVGFAGDQLVATGAFEPVDEKTVVLRRIRVHPDYQRRGYGAQLLATLEERADEAGYDETTIDEMGLNTSAQAFLEAHGYEVTGKDVHLGSELVSYRKPIA